MKYEFLDGETVEAGVHRIASEQLDAAIKCLTGTESTAHESVHDVRKRCKKLRGLLRLVRPALGNRRFQRENACFRDSARQLSFLRDAQSVIECFDKLIEHFSEQLDTDVFRPIREELESRRAEVSEDLLEQRVAEFLAEIRDARKRVDSWSLDAEGFDAIAGGLCKTYGRARKRMADAYTNRSVETFHEWRKRVKYHWYHARLLKRIWPDCVKPHRDAADHLSDLLGDDHDLAVLRGALLDGEKQYGDRQNIAILIDLIDLRRAQLQGLARPLGERLFAEKPKQIAQRFGHYWTAWRMEPELQSLPVRQTETVLT